MKGAVLKQENIDTYLVTIAHAYNISPPLKVDDESSDIIDDVCMIYARYGTIGSQEIDLLKRIRDRIQADEDHANDSDVLGLKHRSIYRRGF